ncbi:MAG: hybrid sensor histidine kinase/response regulator [Methylacidiphilales bacterium]|nr:hybrid sensor histidine kinase/response regulator [Candidatus Methylacidiphilales bacterium]
MKTILIVDDNQLLVQTYSMALRQSGYNVIEADSGVAGLALARKHLPDLILSDIDMPGGDGTTLLREIRHDPELRLKQVVLMTGRPDLVTPRKGMEEGADDFLLKPVGLEVLQGCVEARFRRTDISWRVEDRMLTQLGLSVPPQLPHELFIPMAGIIGLLQILRSDLPTLSPVEVSEMHNEIYKSALRIQRTLRNYLLILDLPSASSESVPPPLSPEHVEESIQEGIHEVLRQHERRDDVGLWMSACSISVKPGDLSRIVEELVDNACKFSRRGTPVKVVLGTDGRLIIRDKGRGLTAEEISRIGAFQQFDHKKNEQQGLGLGLVLVQKLAALSGAKFLITSQPGEGTQVEVTFPSQEPEGVKS